MKWKSTATSGSIRVSRREVLKGLFAAMGLAAVGENGRLFAAPDGWRAPGAPNLVFGVLADTHLRTNRAGTAPGKMWPVNHLRSALERFRDEGVDAIVHVGDFAHRGQVAEMQFHADVWRKVFASGTEPVKLFVTGNHDVIGATYGNFVKKIYPDSDEFARHVLSTDMAGNWERIWGEKYEGVWHREVKGFHFFGRNYDAPHGELVDAVKSYAAQISPKDAKPFFIVQHRIPTREQRNPLKGFHNAVAFFGHWHASNADWRTVKFNCFPMIECGACRPDGGNSLGDGGLGKCPMLGLKNHARSREGMIVKVYGDCLVIERHEFVSGGKIGADWVMPFGQYAPHPLSGPEMKKAIGEPQFPAGARLKATVCMAPVIDPGGRDALAATVDSDAETYDNGDEPVRDAATKEECAMRIFIPRADGNPVCRAYAFDVVVAGDAGGEKLFKTVLANGCNLAPGKEPDGGVTSLVVRLSELPEGENLTFAVRPVTSLKTAGAPITAKLLFDKLKRRSRS